MTLVTLAVTETIGVGSESASEVAPTKANTFDGDIVDYTAEETGLSSFFLSEGDQTALKTAIQDSSKKVKKTIQERRTALSKRKDQE